MIKKQTKTIIILVAAMLALGLLYFFAVRPILESPQEQQHKYDKDGDLLDKYGSAYVFEPVERQDIKHIKVQNQNGGFTLVRDSVTDELVFEGAERMVYDSALMSALYVDTCQMSAIQKLENPKEDLSIYGLDLNQNPATVEVQTQDGKTNTVYVGDKLITGGAYYVKHKDKPYIYAVSDSIQTSILCDIKDYFVPQAAPEIDSNSYGYIEHFVLKKNGETFIECEFIPDEQREQSGEINIHRMIYPANYIPSNQNYLDALSCFVKLMGEKVLEYEVAKKDNYSEVMTHYGFDKPSFEILYTYNGKETRILLGNKVEDYDGYYAYSLYTDTILLLPTQNVPFINWELLDYVSRDIFQRDIKRVNSITLEFEGQTHEYKLSGEGENLVVTDNGKIVNTSDFRQLYIMLLSMRMQGKAETQVDTSKAPVLTMTVVPDSLKTVEYKFYSLSTGRLFYTIDGKGEFYVTRESINKITEGAKALAIGQEVDANIM